MNHIRGLLVLPFDRVWSWWCYYPHVVQMCAFSGICLGGFYRFGVIFVAHKYTAGFVIQTLEHNSTYFDYY